MLQPKVAVSCCTLCKVQCECFTTKGSCVLLHTMQGTVWMLYNQREPSPVARYARYSVNALQPKVAVSCCMLCKVQCECFTTKGGCVLLYTMQGTVWMLYNQTWLSPAARYARYSVNALLLKIIVVQLCMVQLKVNVSSCAAMHSTAEGKCQR